MGQVERIGSGINRMKDLMLKAHLEEPKHEITSFFKTIFYRNPEYSLKKSTAKGSEKSAEKIFTVIKDNLYIKSHELVNEVKLSQRTVENAIAKLKQAGFLKRIGSPKDGHWETQG